MDLLTHNFNVYCDGKAPRLGTQTVEQKVQSDLDALVKHFVSKIGPYRDKMKWISVDITLKD